jgi:hypothetical protein
VNIHHLIFLETNPTLPIFPLEQLTNMLGLPAGLITSTNEVYDAYQEEINYMARKRRKEATSDWIKTFWGSIWTNRNYNERIFFANQFLENS